MAIVRSIIDLGHNLGLEVVAEGVRTSARRTSCAQIGCDRAQGYFLGRRCRPDLAQRRSRRGDAHRERHDTTWYVGR